MSIDSIQPCRSPTYPFKDAARIRLLKLFICLVLGVGTIVVYAPVRHYDFVNYDDDDYVTSNPHVLGGLTWQNMTWALKSSYSSNWHPLTWVSHMLDIELWGLRAGGHHLTNVLFHAANAVLLFLVFLSMTGARWRSAFVAAVFAWHPLHVESVAWISERKDVLSTLFWILAMAAYLQYVRKPRANWYLLVLALFVCGLMSKPMVVTLPFVLLLFDYWPLQRAALTRNDARKWLGLFLEKVPLLALAVVSSLITILTQHRSGALRSVLQIPWHLRISNAPISYVGYLWEAFWPVRLAVFYPFPAAIPIWQAGTAAAIFLAITALALAAAKRHSYVTVGWLWFAGTLVPVIGLVQVGDQSMADRYMYAPLIGLSIVIAWGVPDMAGAWRHKRLALGAAALLTLGACVAATENQLTSWHDSISLYRRALWPGHNGSGHPVFFDGLADALMRAGRLSEADDVVAQSQRQFPEDAKRLNLAGQIKFKRDETAEAETLWKRALELSPNGYEIHNNLGILYAKKERWDLARYHFKRLIELRPDDVVALGNLAQLCFLTKDYAGAIRYCERGLALVPNDAMLRTLMAKSERQQWNEP